MSQERIVVIQADELRALVREAVRDELANLDRGEPKDVLTLHELAALLKRDRKTIIRLVSEEKLPAHSIGPRELRFRRSEVLAWLSQRGSTVGAAAKGAR